MAELVGMQIVPRQSRPDISLLSRPCPVDRLLSAQAQSHNVEVEALVQAETARAKSFDRRCTAHDIERAAQWHAAAQARFFTSGRAPLAEDPPRILLGPNSKVVDHIIDGPGLQRLIQHLVEQGQEQELLAAINNGPPQGAALWENAQTPVELVASIVRWGTLHGKEKTRMRASDEVRCWVVDTLRQLSVDTKPRLGGVVAVGTRLCQVLGAEPTMMALGKISPDILQYLPAETLVVGSDPQNKTIAELPRAELSAPNLSFQHKGAALPLPLMHCTVQGEKPCLQTIDELDVLVTGAGEAAFHELSQERARELGRGHDVMVLTGAHRLKTHSETENYFRSVEAIRLEGCAIALIHADTRASEADSMLLRTLRSKRFIDYWGMNGSEAYKILDTVLQTPGLLAPEESFLRERITTALAQAQQPTSLWPSGREHPRWIADSALLLQEVFDVPAVRVRGRAVDVLVTAPDVQVPDAEQVRNHLIVSRNLATLKVAELDGLLNSHEDLRPLRNVPDGGYVAALYTVQDLALERLPTAAAFCSVVHSGIHTASDGRTLYAIPPIQFYDRSGGTQSAGDTIDVSFVAAVVGFLFPHRHVEGRNSG